MPSNLLTVISWVALGAGLASALVVVYDELIAGHRQTMAIMAWVWPITALYSGPLGLYFYYRYGRPNSRDYGQGVSVAIGVSHCGAGCTLGDIIGAALVFLLGLKLAGLALWPEYIVDFGLAYLLGVVFQYFSIAPMRGLGLKDGIVAALKADTLSLIAFEIGLFGWMALVQLVFFPLYHLHANTAAYWFLMQIGMLLGFLTAYPVNWWLLKRGLKEAM